MQLSLFVLAFVTVALGAPVPTQDLDRRASDLEARAPVHWMNIQKHRLDEPTAAPGTQSVVGHNLWLRELDEEEFERREAFDTRFLRVGTVILN